MAEYIFQASTKAEALTMAAKLAADLATSKGRPFATVSSCRLMGKNGPYRALVTLGELARVKEPKESEKNDSPLLLGGKPMLSLNAPPVSAFNGEEKTPVERPSRKRR